MMILVVGYWLAIIANGRSRARYRQLTTYGKLAQLYVVSVPNHRQVFAIYHVPISYQALVNFGLGRSCALHSTMLNNACIS